MGKIDIICGLITAAVSALFFAGTLSFPKTSIGINPGTYPRFIIFSTFALSAVLIIQGVLSLRGKSGRNGTAAGGLPSGRTGILLVLLVAGMLVYAFTLELLGYILVTPFLIALAMVLFGERKPLRIILVSVLTSAALYLLFRGVFRVPLPHSWFW